MYYFYNLKYSFSNNFIDPSLRKIILDSLHTFMYVAKREVQDGHVTECKHNLSVRLISKWNISCIDHFYWCEQKWGEGFCGGNIHPTPTASSF